MTRDPVAAPANDSASLPPLLAVSDLRIEFAVPGARVLRAVRGMTYTIGRGEVLGLVGESGCGKSVSALSLLGLLPRHTARVTGSARFRGEELVGASSNRLRRVRGAGIAMIFQDPLTSFDPVLPVGRQIAEALRAHRKLDRSASRARVLELLETVGISDARRRMDAYPHQLSGGMRQRAMLAMALSGEPSLLIADEPTTALDVTIQAQILELLRGLGARLDMSVLLITHNLGLVSGLCDRVAVMYAGQIAEAGSTEQMLMHPRHPYTIGLLRSAVHLNRTREMPLVPIEGQPPDLTTDALGCPFAPRCRYAVERSHCENPPLETVGADHQVACWVKPEVEVVGGAVMTPPPSASGDAAVVISSSRTSSATDGQPLVEVNNVLIHFPLAAGPFSREPGWIHAVDGVSLTIRRGETLGLVGESGCGKTTLGRAVVQSAPVTAGDVRFSGRSLHQLRGDELRQYRRRLQLVFQDPYASLNPRQTVGQLLKEPLAVHHVVPRPAASARVTELLQLVGMDAAAMPRYPHEFSGGQRQRIAIARALSVEPDLIVCDEPISSLDVSIQAQIVNLLLRLQHELELTYLFISHDLAVVRHLAHRVAVMYLGKIMELAPSEEIYTNPRHPYTAALLSAVPVPDPTIQRNQRRIILHGDIPSAVNPARGCRFLTRCWLRQRLGSPEICATTEPALIERPGSAANQQVACHFAEEMQPMLQGTNVAAVAHELSVEQRTF